MAARPSRMTSLTSSSALSVCVFSAGWASRRAREAEDSVFCHGVFDLRVVGDGAVRVGVGLSTAVIACAPIDAILFGFRVIRGFGQHVEYQIYDDGRWDRR